MKIDDVKQGVNSLWESVADGWQRLRETAFGAMTRFKAGSETNVPTPAEVDDAFYAPHGWAMLGGDLFEDDKRLVVKLEVPGMEKDDFSIEVQDDALVVRGEKRFERESSGGRWCLVQCAYGSFRRVVPLPLPVIAEKAKASYKNGVLRVELPKAQAGKPRRKTIHVS